MAIDTNLLSYRDNFQPTIPEKIPFMQDVFAEDVHVTMDSVAFIESDVGKDYANRYKPGYGALKDVQKTNRDPYKEFLIGKGNIKTEKEAEDALRKVESIVNDGKKNPAEKTKDLNALAKEEYRLNSWPDIPSTMTSRQRDNIINIMGFCDKYGKHLKDRGVSGCSLDEFLGENEIKIVNDIASSKSILWEEAIREAYDKKLIKFGPRFLLLNPKISAQKWWELK